MIEEMSQQQKEAGVEGRQISNGTDECSASRKGIGRSYVH